MNRFIVERVLRRERERKSENKEGPRSRSERESKARRPSSCIFVSFPPPLGTDQSPLPLPDARHWTRGIRSRAHGRERLEKRARGREQGRGTCCEVDALSKSIESLFFFVDLFSFLSYARASLPASRSCKLTRRSSGGHAGGSVQANRKPTHLVVPRVLAKGVVGVGGRHCFSLAFRQRELFFFFLSLFPLPDNAPWPFACPPSGSRRQSGERALRESERHWRVHARREKKASKKRRLKEVESEQSKE